MTIQDYSSKSSTSLLTSLLNKPIKKQSLKPRVSQITKNSLQSTLNLVRTTSRKFQIPIKSAHHRVNHTWSTNNNNTSPILSSDNKTVLFHPDCTSCFETEAIRTNKPLKLNSFSYWEVTLLDKRSMNGTSLQIGIGNCKSKLSSIGYINLIGSDMNSYGLNHNGFKWHGNRGEKFCEPWMNDISEFETNVTIGCLFNGFNGELSFYKNGKCLGVGFERVDIRDDWYPMVGSTVKESGFRLEFVCESFPSLMDICRKSVLNESETLLGGQSLLPRSVLEFLKV